MQCTVCTAHHLGCISAFVAGVSVGAGGNRALSLLMDQTFVYTRQFSLSFKKCVSNLEKYLNGVGGVLSGLHAGEQDARHCSDPCFSAPTPALSCFIVLNRFLIE